MTTQLVQFTTSDDLLLPGLLFKPSQKTQSVAIYLHGCGSASIFYSKKTHIFAEAITKKNIAFFPFNNRGAHYIKTFTKTNSQGEKEKIYLGTSFERIHECIIDINASVEYLKKLGYKKFFLIGESTGANKIVVYNYYVRNHPINKFVLLSGGDDTGLYFEMLGKDTFAKALKRAQIEVKNGRGMKMVPNYLVNYPFSWQSLYDVINPEGDYNIFPYYDFIHALHLSKKPKFREFKKIQKQTKIIYGQNDEYCFGNVPLYVDILKKHNHSPHISYSIISEANHSFEGKEQQLSEEIADFLEEN